MAAKHSGMSPEQVLIMATDAIDFAVELIVGSRAVVEFSAEAASTTDPRFLERVIKESLNHGASVINIPDTVGQRDPAWMRGYYARAINWVMATNPEATISAHNHNDMGMAVANSIALVTAASEYVQRTGRSVNVQLEGTICGLGERAGNADIFPMAAYIFKLISEQGGVEMSFNPSSSVDVANFVMSAAGLEVPRQSPVVGRDTNVHRSGIHSDGIIKGGHRIYTPFDPVFWGHDADARHEDGEYQGRAGRAAAQAL